MTFDALTVLWGLAAFTTSYGMFKVLLGPRVYLRDDSTPPSEAEVQAAYNRSVPAKVIGQALLLSSCLIWPVLVWVLGMPEEGEEHYIIFDGLGLVLIAVAVGIVAGRNRQSDWSRSFVRKHPQFDRAMANSTLTIFSTFTLVVPLAIIAAGAILRRFAPNSLPFTITAMLMQAILPVVAAVRGDRLPKEFPAEDSLEAEVSRACEIVGVPSAQLFLIPGMRPQVGVGPGNRVEIPACLVELLSREQLVALIVRRLVQERDRIDHCLGLRASAVVAPIATVGVILLFRRYEVSFPLAQVIQIVLLCLAASVPIFIGLTAAYSRKLQLECDRKVAELGYGPALAEALDILHRYQMKPSVWSKALAWQMMHASLRDRLAAITNTRPITARTGTSESAGA